MKKSKRIKKSNSWKIKQHRDQFFKKSKTLGYRSRASFKLIELNQKFKFIKKNTNLLDLGSCPGGWSQVASKIITNGKILSIDIKAMEPIKNVKFVKDDILKENTKDKVLSYFRGKLDVIISDMAADTTGNKSLDSIRTNQLCADVINFSSKTLNSNGVLVSKLFMGEDFIEVKNLAKSIFKNVNFFKPESSRNESKETYLHCVNLKTL
ncbi:RlmE family RNA methyltransferase [Pelagibacteraceae bacterium]|jgi:23S rRNA (uridine2552-2'-O)-methyltransferase|nr:RlmE family RNA methyltransferase [Pelagibacteraceae bacterium]MDC0530411.1 RlmE family RNA methyltransferase [Pelagibacteraceae bacterium]MDC0952712.1 RlmE family RNA methyltransferase [Pelagibacteraceae bacterium]